MFSAGDLGIEPAKYRVIQQVVLGRTKRMASETVGYSERQMRRILHQFNEAASVGPDFRWSLLAPLIAA